VSIAKEQFTSVLCSSETRKLHASVRHLRETWSVLYSLAFRSVAIAEIFRDEVSQQHEVVKTVFRDAAGWWDILVTNVIVSEVTVFDREQIPSSLAPGLQVLWSTVVASILLGVS